MSITAHKGSEANSMIEIICDEKADGGASHIYKIRTHLSAGPDVFADIKFQQGAVTEVGRNGITDESLIAVVIDRLRGFQCGPFACRENALVITKLEEAMHWLNHRTADRVARGVEGKSAA